MRVLSLVLVILAAFPAVFLASCARHKEAAPPSVDTGAISASAERVSKSADRARSLAGATGSSIHSARTTAERLDYKATLLLEQLP